MSTKGYAVDFGEDTTIVEIHSSEIGLDQLEHLHREVFRHRCSQCVQISVGENGHIRMVLPEKVSENRRCKNA
jgi:hypothetical protein